MKVYHYVYSKTLILHFTDKMYPIDQSKLFSIIFGWYNYIYTKIKLFYNINK